MMLGINPGSVVANSYDEVVRLVGTTDSDHAVQAIMMLQGIVDQISQDEVEQRCQCREPWPNSIKLHYNAGLWQRLNDAGNQSLTIDFFKGFIFAPKA